MLIVVALGGNAVSLPGKEGNIAEQFAATRAAMAPLAELLLAGHQLVITHGNGPQVGNVMRRVEIAAQQGQVYPLPLDIVVADTEAGMGYMISQCLMNELAARGRPQVCATIVTTVRVDADDPAFTQPDKPIGPFLTQEQAERRQRQDGWTLMEDSGRGWRRVVPSPMPREIVELPLLKRMCDAGELFVAAGGGGIPVTRDAAGNFRGAEAVIDKDRTSALLAAELNADMLAILTNVEQVQLDYGKPSARPIDRISARELSQHLRQGQFPAGSMGPKIEAAISFLERSNKPAAQVLVTSCERVAEGFRGETGTRVVRG